MGKNGSIRAINERLARKIQREGKADPKSPYANRYVGIAHGKVVVIADSFDEVGRALRQVEPDGSQCYVVDLVSDYDRVYDV